MTSTVSMVDKTSFQLKPSGWTKRRSR